MAQKIYDHFHPPGRSGVDDTPVVSVTATGVRETPADGGD